MTISLKKNPINIVPPNVRYETEGEIHLALSSLAAASGRTLANCKGLIEIKNPIQTQVNWMCYLWREDLGDFGTLEIHETRPGWSKIYIKGLWLDCDDKGIWISNDDKRRETKSYIFDGFVKAFFLLLPREMAQEAIPTPKAGTKTDRKSRKDKAQENINPFHIPIINRAVWEKWSEIAHNKKLLDLFDSIRNMEDTKNNDLTKKQKLQEMSEYIKNLNWKPSKPDTVENIFWASEDGWLQNYDRDKRRLEEEKKKTKKSK
jgi:hypothetical protein